MKQSLLAAAILVTACSPSRTETAASPSATASAATAAATSAVVDAVKAQSARANDARWIAARDEDPAGLMRLAAVEGAAGLLDGLADGGDTAATALRALPYADDAETALGRLGALLARAQGEPQAALLRTILAIAGEPRRPREALDAEGVRSCFEALISLSSRADAIRENRATAVSAARALAERGSGDPRKIPGDLDPK